MGDDARFSRGATTRAVARALALGVAALSFAGTARADAEGEAEPAPLRIQASALNTPAPRRALEASVDVAFVQPTGGVSAGHSAQESIGAGLELGLALGYRASPFWSIDLRGQLHDSQGRSPDAAGDVRGVAVVAGPTFHLLPYELVDPYFSLALGYRALMEQRDGAVARPVTSGLDLLRLQTGLDLRVSPSAAVSLYVAGDLTTFLWGSSESSFGTPSGTPQLSAFFSAGAQARFDFGGVRQRRATFVASH